MKKLKHTPGPWSYTILGPHRNNKEVLAIEINYGKDGECIADTVYEEADARLIAAAPDMLDTLIAQYRGICHVCAEGCSCDGMCAGKEVLRTVIEKATGLKIEEIIK